MEINKPFYKHHSEKVIVPVLIKTDDLFLNDSTIEAVEKNGFNMIDTSVTVRHKKDDDDAPDSYEVDGIDVDVDQIPADLVLYKDSIVRACEDYIWENETEIANSQTVVNAFVVFNAAKMALRCSR